MIKHIFYCPFTGKTPRSDTQSQEWYDKRAKLFEKYTLESLKKQTRKDFIFWASFRPQEIDNPTTKKIEKALKKAEINYILTFNGSMMTEDRALWHNFDLKERLNSALPKLRKLINGADYIYETNLDSDDTVHHTFSEVVQEKEFKHQGALYMTNGYSYNTDDILSEWHNPESNQNYTVMFPVNTYFDAEKRLEYLKGLKTHEEIPTLFDAEKLPDGLYCTIIHGSNISTVWSHPFRGEIVDKSILNNFI